MTTLEGTPMNKRSLIRIAAMLTLIAGIAAIAAGCGSSDEGTGGGGGGYASKGGGAAADTTAPSPEKTGAAVVSAASVPKLGRLIVDSKGHTLYDFHKDKG